MYSILLIITAGSATFIPDFDERVYYISYIFTFFPHH